MAKTATRSHIKELEIDSEGTFKVLDWQKIVKGGTEYQVYLLKKIEAEVPILLPKTEWAPMKDGGMVSSGIIAGRDMKRARGFGICIENKVPGSDVTKYTYAYFPKLSQAKAQLPIYIENLGKEQDINIFDALKRSGSL